MTNITLYQLANDYRALLDLGDETQLLDKLNQLTDSIPLKANSLVRVMRHLEHMASAQEAELADLRERARRNRSHVDWLKKYLLDNMVTMGIDELDAGPFRLRVVNNPHAVQVDDASKVPSEYQRTKIEISVDKRAILDNFRVTGEIPEGVSITRGQGIRIS